MSSVTALSNCRLAASGWPSASCCCPAAKLASDAAISVTTGSSAVEAVEAGVASAGEELAVLTVGPAAGAAVLILDPHAAMNGSNTTANRHLIDDRTIGRS